MKIILVRYLVLLLGSSLFGSLVMQDKEISLRYLVYVPKVKDLKKIPKFTSFKYKIDYLKGNSTGSKKMHIAIY